MKSIRLMVPIFLVIFMLISTAAGFSEEKILESKWTAEPPKIDGLNIEWSEDVLTTEKSVMVDYAVRNDAQCFYLLFIFKDPKSLSSISATGITLYFNTEGKKQKKNGFHFVKKQVTGEELIKIMERQGEVFTEEQKQEIKAKPSYYVYAADMVGKKGKKAPETSQTPDDLRPAFRIANLGNEVVYEFRVPLASSETAAEGIGVEPGQKVMVGFEWGGMTDEMRKAMNAGLINNSDLTGESAAGSMIVPGSGESRAPRGGRNMPKKHNFWVNVRLAQMM